MGLPGPLETIDSRDSGERTPGSPEDQPLSARGLGSQESPPSCRLPVSSTSSAVSSFLSGHSTNHALAFLKGLELRARCWSLPSVPGGWGGPLYIFPNPLSVSEGSPSHEAAGHR